MEVSVSGRRLDIGMAAGPGAALQLMCAYLIVSLKLKHRDAGFFYCEACPIADRGGSSPVGTSALPLVPGASDRGGLRESSLAFRGYALPRFGVKEGDLLGVYSKLDRPAFNGAAARTEARDESELPLILVAQIPILG